MKYVLDSNIGNPGEAGFRVERVEFDLEYCRPYNKAGRKLYLFGLRALTEATHFQAGRLYEAFSSDARNPANGKCKPNEFYCFVVRRVSIEDETLAQNAESASDIRYSFDNGSVPAGWFSVSPDSSAN